MEDLRLYLFGAPRIEFKNQAVKLDRRKALALAAYLALSEQPQSRDALAALLWPELDDMHARSALRSTLRALTVDIPVDWLSADRMTVALKRDAIWIDVFEFTQRLGETGTHGHGADVVCDACVEPLKRAVDLYHADLLAGFHLADSPDFDEWHLTQSEWLRREYAEILHRLSNHFAEIDQLEQAINYALLWLASDPINEPAHRQLMRLYAANGQRSEALRQYKQCADILDRELATPPERQTSELYRVIQSDESPEGVLPDDMELSATSVMPPLPPLVIGREEALSEIKRRLGIGSDEVRPVTVVQGWPGAGKSTTVATLAHDRVIAHQFPDGVLWASLGEAPDIYGALDAWAAAFKLSDPGRARKVEEISALLTAILRNKRVLLIVDDVWRAEHVVPFRVGGQSCAMIFTSRLNDVANELAPGSADIYRLPLLDEAHGIELLKTLTPETVSDYPDEAQQLARDLEGLPLALHVAGRLLHAEARLGWGVRELLAELRTGASLLAAQAPSDMIGARGETSPTIAVLLKRSTDLLDEDYRLHYAYLSLFAPKPATFDLEAMQVAWNVPDPRPIARTLVNRGLLEPVGGGRFQMHALLVLHARALLEQLGDPT
ncbi:MAG: hypothetical protein KJ065_26230 [Anaerolineae bacterium]|nr:hypothetical protein [Anaerolineae bacterium]